MNKFKNSASLRSTKAAIVGTTIALVALAGTYFYNEYQEEKVIAYVTRPTQSIEIDSDYYNNLLFEEFIQETEETKIFSK